MPTYTYRARDSSGQLRTGEIEAGTKADAKMKVSRKRLQLLGLQAKGGKKSADDDDEGETPIVGNFIYRDANDQIQISLGSQAPTTKDIIIFTRQFGTMLNSGVPMIQALTVLGKQQPSRVFRRALRRVRITVENGSTLSNAMKEFPKIFDELYTAMVAAGEVSGNLDKILARLVTYIEKANKIKGQVKSAMIYPIIVLVVAFAVVTGLLVFIVPVFAEQFSEGGKELPALTQFVIDVSNFCVDHVGTGFSIIAGVLVGLYNWVKTEKGRIQFDKWILRSPAIGPVLQKIAVGRFCSTMASLLGSGINLLQALGICAASAGNRVIEAFILNVRSELEKGRPLSEPLGEGTLFPDMVISMVAVGEKTGALDEMLQKVSDFYEEEVDLAVAAMLSMIEPIMIISIGGIVGFIVIAMYLPIFEMAGSIS